MTAVGVASPKAQGQAITRTATACSIENAFELLPAGKDVAGIHSKRKMATQTRNVINASSNTTGTKIADILSANFWIGAREACASCTKPIIRASVLSEPVFTTFIKIDPVWFTVPPINELPTTLYTGFD